MSDTPEQLLALTEEERKQVAVRKREMFEASITDSANIWGYSALGLESKKAAMTMLSTKHGLYASVPILCKEVNCPYAQTCKLLGADLAPVGEPCPLETAQIEQRFLAYSEEFDLENSSFTDNVIVNEIIETDIMMERCKKLISMEILPIHDEVVNITEDGTEVTAPQVSKTIELNERLSRKRGNLFSMMKATRKDKKEDVSQVETLSDILAMALEREEKQEFVIDVKPEHLS